MTDQTADLQRLSHALEVARMEIVRPTGDPDVLALIDEALSTPTHARLTPDDTPGMPT